MGTGHTNDNTKPVEAAELASTGTGELGTYLRPAVVAIDGPAASGKSTVGQLLAEALGYLFFDTGVMYRAVTWAALERHLDVNDACAVGALAESVIIDIVPDGAQKTNGATASVLVDGRDVTQHIRTAAVDKAVSLVSAHERVRASLTAQQRRVAQQYGEGDESKAGVVMVGRDIGSVVIPEAPVKIYLDATAEERARRRFGELRSGGVAAAYDSVLQDIVRRDGIDSARALAPLSLAEGASVLDTTDLSLDDVVEKILHLIQNAVVQE